MLSQADVLGVGTGPTALGGSGSSGLINYPIETYVTPTLDLTQTVSGIELIPAKPGHVPLVYLARWIIYSVTGTQTTPATHKAGNNTAHTNIFASSSTNPSNANVNAAAPVSTAAGPVTVQPSNITPNAPVIFDLTSGAVGTGGFALRARLAAFVIWVAQGS